MSLPSPSDLIYFQELVKVKNISRAAERLGITQPSLSLSLKRLEDQIGVQLFVRSKSGVVPTLAGLKLAKSSELLIQDWKGMKNEIVRSQNEAVGQFRLGCHTSVAKYSMGAWVKKILEQHKNLDFECYHDLSRKVLSELINFKLDLAIVVNPVPHPDLVVVPLAKDFVTLRCLKRGHFNEQVLIFDGELSQSQALLRQLKKKSLFFKQRLISSDLGVIEHLVSKGAGVGILPGKVAGANLKEFDSKIKPFSDKICAVYRADTLKTKSFEVVLSAIKAHFKV